MTRKNRRLEFTPEPISVEPSVLKNQARRMREQSREQFWTTLECLPEDERTAFWNAKYVRQRDHKLDRTAVCQLPNCDRATIRLAGRSLGICDYHAMPVMQWTRTVMDEHEHRMLDAATEANRIHRQRAQDRADERRREKALTEPGWVYYLHIGDRIKIGYTVDVRRRLRAYPPGSPLLALHPGTKETEHDMHVRFVGSRAAGREWFLDSPELRDHIKAVIEQYGEPDRARYEHRGQRRNRRLKAS